MIFLQNAVLACLFGLGLSRSLPPPIARREPSTTTSAPSAQPTICGKIINAVDKDQIVFDALDAYDCLTSVPFLPDVATRFIHYYNTTLQFQSTLAYLKDPPPGYQQPAVDVLNSLQQIQHKVNAGYYYNQYDFEVDLQLLVYSLHDDHIVLSAGVLSVFDFASPYPISSASVDGQQLPNVYMTGDIIDSQTQGWQPSQVVSINGEDVVSYLTSFAALNSAGKLEPHADWNELMDTPALDVQGLFTAFSGAATFYPGDSLNFTFANGTELNTYWLAVYKNPNPTGPLATGGDFYNYFVLGLYPASFNSSQSSNTAAGSNSTATTATTSWFNASSGAYPAQADISQRDLSVEGGGVVSGYFLTDISTGVLSLPSFDQFGFNVGNFSEAVALFIRGSRAANLTRVIIDVQQNSGGNVELAFDTFRQFFPDIDPFAGSRRRSHSLANVLGSATTAYWQSLPDGSVEYYDLMAKEWVVTDRLNAATNKNFTSWEEFYGPERYNLSSISFDAAAFEGWIPYGSTEDNPVTTTRPWDPENVVVLTDGLCSSACSLFVEMLTHDANVRTLAAGGRPNPGPMQAVSGSRGARAYSADLLDGDFGLAAGINASAAALLARPPDTGIFTLFAGFNLRDQVRAGDPVPLQFRYEAADCRIYYTLANAYNMSRLWRDAARAMWADGTALCVANSTGYPNGRNNGSAARPAPAPAAVTLPSLDLAGSRHVNSVADGTGGLPDGIQPASRKLAVVPCDAAGRCADGVSLCEPVSITCQTGQRLSVAACLPPCMDPNACPGDTMCDLRNKMDSKVNSFNNKNRAGNAVSNYGVVQRAGFCVPTMGTSALGCPSKT